MPTGQPKRMKIMKKPDFSLRSFLLLCARSALTGLLTSASMAHAQTYGQCAKEAAGCVVNVAKSAYYATGAVADALEFAARHPNCVADIASGNPTTILVSSSIVSVAALGGISSSSYDSCKSGLYGAAARPLASAISQFVPHPKLQSFVNSTGADAASEGFEAIATSIPVPSPGAPNLAMQLTCGCAVAAAGAGMIDNLKHMLIATAAAADQCTGAMSCLGAATLNAIADVGKAVGKVAVATAQCAWTPNDCGEKEAMPPEQYWTYAFAPFVPEYADLLVRPNTKIYCSTNSIYEYKTCSGQVELENKRNACLDYHKAHKTSADTARDRCNPMRDRVISEAQVIYERRMADEEFPKRAIQFAKKTFPLNPGNAYQSGDFEFCSAPKDPNRPAGLDLTGATTYVGTSESLALSNQCVDALLRSIGIDRQNNLVLNGASGMTTLLADAKAKSMSSKWNFDESFKKAYDTWTSRRNAIKANYAPKIAAAAKGDNISLLLNTEYAKSALKVYVAGVAACPKAGQLGRSDCVRDMRDYMGMDKTFSLSNPTEGFIDFNDWGSKPPKPYLSALSLLEKVKEAKGNVAEAVSGAVSWAMDDAAKMLTTFPAKSIADANKLQAIERERQKAQLEKAQEKLSDNYSVAKYRCKRNSCVVKVDEVRQVEKLQEASYLNKLLVTTGSNPLLRGLDVYLSSMEALDVATRSKYKSILDLEITYLSESDVKKLSAGSMAVGMVGGAPSPTAAVVLPPTGQMDIKGQSAGIGAPTRGNASNPVISAGAGSPSANIGDTVSTNRPPAIAPHSNTVIGMPAAPGMQAAALPRPSAPVATPIGMPGAPGMIAVAPRPAPAPAVVNTPPSPPTGVTLQAAAPAAAAPTVFVPPPSFNETLYRSSRRQAMDKEWLTPCKSDIDCQRDVNGLLREWLDAEVARIKSDTAILSSTQRLAAMQESLENSYESRIKQEWPKAAASAPTAPPVMPKDIPKTLNTTNPTSPPPGIRR
jgi:hypothetical protein